MIDTITTIATGVGYAVLTLFALIAIVALWAVLSPAEDTTDDGRTPDNTINALIEEELPNPEQYDRLTAEPKPVTGIDWSTHGPTAAALEAVVERLRDSHTVHPYAQSPGPIDNCWQWSTGHAGVYAERPTFYAVADDERVPVTPDLSTWDGWDTAEYEIEPAYTAGDAWEREHLE